MKNEPKRKSPNNVVKDIKGSSRSNKSATSGRVQRQEDNIKIDDEQDKQTYQRTTNDKLRQETKDVEAPRRSCLGNGIYHKCEGMLPKDCKPQKKWCSDACRMYVNFKTRPRFAKLQKDRRKQISLDRGVKTRKAYKPRQPKSQIETVKKTQVIPEVDAMPKDAKEMVWDEAKKAMTSTKDPLLNFIGNYGDLIGTVVKEVVKGFTDAKGENQQRQLAQIQQQQKQNVRVPRPPSDYGKIECLKYKNDTAWQNQAREWESYVRMKKSGVNDTAPPIINSSSDSAIERTGATSLREVASISKQMDAQSKPAPSPAQSDDDLARIEEYRNNKSNDPLADKITKPTKEETEIEVEQSMTDTRKLVEEKLQLVIVMIKNTSDEKILEWSKNSEKAVAELNEKIKNPMVAMIFEPYIPVIKQMKKEDLDRLLRDNCPDKVKVLSDESYDDLLGMFEKWRDSLN